MRPVYDTAQLSQMLYWLQVQDTGKGNRVNSFTVFKQIYIQQACGQSEAYAGRLTPPTGKSY